MATLNKAGRNERRKITATAANNVAVSFFVTGIVLPVVSSAYQLSTPHTRYWGLFAVVWLAVGIIFHIVSRHILGGIEE